MGPEKRVGDRGIVGGGRKMGGRKVKGQKMWANKRRVGGRICVWRAVNT